MLGDITEEGTDHQQLINRVLKVDLFAHLCFYKLSRKHKLD